MGLFNRNNGGNDKALYSGGGRVPVPTTTINFYGPRYKFLFLPYHKLCCLMTAPQEYIQESYRYIRSVVSGWLALKKQGKYLFCDLGSGRTELKDEAYFLIDDGWLQSTEGLRGYMKNFGVDINDYEIVRLSVSQVLSTLARYGF